MVSDQRWVVRDGWSAGEHRTKHIAQLIDVCALPHERREDQVDPLLHAERQVRLVLRRDRGQRQRRAGQVDALALAKRAGVGRDRLDPARARSPLR